MKWLTSKIQILILALIFVLLLVVSISTEMASSYLSKSYPTSALRGFLEIIYFLCAPLIVFAAIYGLKQISLTRENAITAAKRESYRIAAEQVAFYSTQIVPILDNFDAALKRKRIKSLGESEIIYENKGFKLRAKFHNTPALKQIVVPLVESMNALESFAMYFVTGVAESEVAFHAVGRSFCSSVKTFLPFIVTTEGAYFKNIVRLYGSWNSLLLKQDAMKAKRKAESTIESAHTISFKSIGT